MPESQSHGFLFENQILKDIYGSMNATTEGYIKKYDLDAIHNHIDTVAYNLSIKSTGSNRVDMGSALRVYDSLSDEPFSLINVSYTQVGETKKVTNVVQVDLTNGRELLFGNVKREDIEKLDTMVKQKSPEETDICLRKIYNKELNNKSKYIQFNAKVDKKQRRLQCSFPAFFRFLIENQSLILHRSEGAKFRGVVIEDVETGPRERKRKKNFIAT